MEVTILCEVACSFTDENLAYNLIEWQYFSIRVEIAILHHHSRQRSVEGMMAVKMNDTSTVCVMERLMFAL
jgi:hypothetical protein